MKIIRLLLIGTLLTTHTAHAQSTVDLCRQEVHRTMATEHRLFRSVIFGEPTPEKAPIGHVVASTSGNNWIKTSDSEWQSLADGFTGTIRNNTQVEEQSAVPARRGILETKRVTTSDLIPPMVNAMRSFECRLNTYCKLAQESAVQDNSATGPTEFTIQLAGCEEQTFTRVAACSPKEDDIEQSDITDILTYCSNVTQDLLSREQRLLAMTVEYDAAYRSTIQFAGDFDQFVEQLRFPMENTIRQVVGVLGSLQRVPCFLSSCADYPLPSAPIAP